MHILPRMTFSVQLVATFVRTFISVGELGFRLMQISDAGAQKQPNNLTCPGQNTLFTAPMLLGTLDSSGMYGRDAIYSPLIELALPAVVFFFRDKPDILKYFHPPVFLLGSLIQCVGSVGLMLMLIRTTLF